MVEKKKHIVNLQFLLIFNRMEDNVIVVLQKFIDE